MRNSNNSIRPSPSSEDCSSSSLCVSTLTECTGQNSHFKYPLQVPETKGLSLEEMDEAFGAQGLAAADLRRQAEISDRIGLSAYDDHHQSPTEKYEADSYKGDKA